MAFVSIWVKRMKTALPYVASVIVIGCLAGCSSIGVRASKSHNSPRFLYSGVQEDVKLARAPFCRYEYQPGKTFSMPWFITPLSVIDLPLSFVADTLCLPYDVYVVTLGGHDRHGKAKDRQQSPAGDDLKAAPEE